LTVEVIAEFDALFRARSPSLVAVDIPIGLPEQMGAGGRGAERAARPILGPRRSSVFSTPCRASVYAADYAEACRLSLENSQPRRKLSRQAFHIMPKIREVDTLLRTRPELRSRVYEVHPELSFWALNGLRPMKHNKKSAEGIAERRSLLQEYGVSANVLDMPLKGAGTDDLNDALVALLTAQRIRRGEAVTFPTAPEIDSFGIACAITA